MAPARQPPERRRWQDPPGRLREVELPAGDVTEGVVRVGGTVRRPHQPTSLPVAHYLDHLEDVAFPGSPRFLGRDDLGRDVLTYLPGRVAGACPERWSADEGLLASVGALVARLHRASAGFDPALRTFPDTRGAGPGSIVSHFDVTPQNVVVRGRRAAGLIDFDLARRGLPLHDVANTAVHWVPLRDPVDHYPGWPEPDAPRRLAVLADGYGLGDDDRARFVRWCVEAADGSYLRMEQAARERGGGWARMWAEGVGDLILRRRRWLLDHEAELTRALTG